MATVASRITAVVLAAGRSTRMGRNKATLPLGSDTFLTHIVRTFHEAGVHDTIAVLGHDAAIIAPSVSAAGFDTRIVINANYDRGQLSSLLAGLEAADRDAVDAILMTLVDIPLISTSTVRAVIERYEMTRAPIVRPVNGARHGHPILIARSIFPALRAASDAEGAKPVVRAYASIAGDVPVDDEGAFRDVDTMDEYERLTDAGDGRPGEAPATRS